MATQVSTATIEFNKKCIPSSEYVVLRTINRHDGMKIGDILIADSAFSNDRLGFYQIEAVGKKAAEEYGLKEGDYVCADRLAQVYKTSPISVMKYVNVICKTNENNSKFYPLKNMVFVKDESNTTQNVGGILVNNYNKSLKIGKVVSMNLADGIEVPFEVGDNVMLSKGADEVQIGNEKVFIYKHDMVVCKVCED